MHQNKNDNGDKGIHGRWRVGIRGVNEGYTHAWVGDKGTHIHTYR